MVPNCSPGHDASIGTQSDLPRSNFEAYMPKSLFTMSFYMTSGEFQTDLTKKVFFFYKSCRSSKELSSTVCLFSLRFVVFEI